MSRRLAPRALAAALIWLACAALVWAATALPALTGRVVDDAHILSAATKATLEGKLADLEQKSTIQLVVATVPSLDGQDIETYANTLFRHWNLGQAKKNNGVLFVIAPSEHKMRIEVGYGLEGTLTDATSKLIIANAAAPRFKTGDFDGGVTRAVEDIVTALTVDASEWRKFSDLQPGRAANGNDGGSLLPLLFFLFILIVIWNLNRKSRRTGGAWIVPINMGGGSSGGWSSGGSSDGGFSGGGGSSGGGGASGGW
ncbi:MAG: TPM domain-containing protein [Pseudomonadota bacterium]|nr:TPM domain-containing protein [Pseudomonadota bacterium]